MKQLFAIFLLTACTMVEATLAKATPQATPRAIPRVIVSIKPLHSLVASVMQGVGQPELLLSGQQSLHHASLKPSQINQLVDADLVVWTGPVLEFFLRRYLKQISKARVLKITDIPDLFTLPVRHHSHTHTKQNSIDPHLWLSFKNAQRIVEEVTRKLSTIDPEHATQYQANSQKMHLKIKQLKQKIIATNSAAQPVTFIAYHDAYQYFTNEFTSVLNIQNAGFISTSNDAKSGIKHLQKIHSQLQKQTIHCLIYDGSIEPKAIHSLSQNRSVLTVATDITGTTLNIGPDLWPNIMLNLAKSFKQCAFAE